MHESLLELSRGTLARFKADCGGYTVSYYDPAVPLGTMHPQLGVRCGNLECLMFPGGSFDLVLTLDVYEHGFRPNRAIKEVERVIKLADAAQSRVCDSHYRGS